MEVKQVTKNSEINETFIPEIKINKKYLFMFIHRVYFSKQRDALISIDKELKEQIEKLFNDYSIKEKTYELGVKFEDVVQRNFDKEELEFLEKHVDEEFSIIKQNQGDSPTKSNR